MACRIRGHGEQREWLAEASLLSERKSVYRQFLNPGDYRGSRGSSRQVRLPSPLRRLHQGTYRLQYGKQRAKLGVAQREGGPKVLGQTVTAYPTDRAHTRNLTRHTNHSKRVADVIFAWHLY